MNRKEMINDMKKAVKAGFISKQQLSDFLGYKSPNSVSKYLYGLASIDRRYYIPDVVDSLLSFKGVRYQK